MVERIEEYGDVLKVILKSTKKFPNGYFYTDNNPIARQLIKDYTWVLTKHSNNIYVVAKIGTKITGQKILRFHQEYARQVLGYYPDCIDHRNRLEIDNRDSNLNIVSQQQNTRNRPTLGYHIANNHCFIPCYKLNEKSIIGVVTRPSQKPF